MGQIQERKKRVEILLVLVVIAGLLWSAKFSPDNTVPAPNVNLTSAAPKPALIEGPAPSVFERFNLPSKKVIERLITCADLYYTFAIFPAGVDYRRSPNTAVYNTATPCVKGERLNASLALERVSAPAGEYYFILADQGEGVWYNPR